MKGSFLLILWMWWWILFGVTCLGFVSESGARCRLHGWEQKKHQLKSSRQDDFGSQGSDNDKSDSLDRQAFQWDLRNLLSSDKLLIDHLQQIYQSAKNSITAENSHTTSTASADLHPISLQNSQLEMVRSFVKSYASDLGHAGRFGVDENHSLQANLVFAM